MVLVMIVNIHRKTAICRWVSHANNWKNAEKGTGKRIARTSGAPTEAAKAVSAFVSTFTFIGATACCFIGKRPLGAFICRPHKNRPVKKRNTIKKTRHFIWVFTLYE